MEKYHNEKTPISGFFVGFIFGVAAALILKSKQGRRILKTIIESGIDKFGDIENVIKDSIEINDDLIDGGDFTAPDAQIESKEQEHPQDKEKTKLAAVLESGTDKPEKPNIDLRSDTSEAVTAVKRATRRFFKGIKKRS